MTNPSLTYSVADLPSVDRWSVYYRLQELGITCSRAEDGSLRVTIDNPLHAILLRSVITRWLAPKQDLIDWLDRCWALLS